MTTFQQVGKYQWNFYNQSSQSFVVNMEPVVDTGQLYIYEETLQTQLGLMAYLVNSIVSPSDIEAGNYQPSQTIAYTADTGGNITLAPGQTLIFEGWNHVANTQAFDFQLSGAETIYVDGQWMLCTYTPHNRSPIIGIPDQQYVNLLGENGFTITENTSTQNEVTGNGIQILLTAPKDHFETDNMFFQVTDSVAGWIGGIGSINYLYLAAFGRTADEGGLTYWKAKLDSGLSKIDLTNIFLSSDEYNTLHKSNEDFIKELYVDLLERNGETGGLQSWIGALESGVSRAVVVNAFTHSAEFVQLVGQVAPAAAAPLSA